LWSRSRNNICGMVIVLNFIQNSYKLYINHKLIFRIDFLLGVGCFPFSCLLINNADNKFYNEKYSKESKWFLQEIDHDVYIINLISVALIISIFTLISCLLNITKGIILLAGIIKVKYWKVYKIILFKILFFL